MTSPVELNSIASLVQQALVGSGEAKILDYQLTLLELFTYEVKRHEQRGLCDYELAYVSYVVATLFPRTENELSKGIAATLLKKKPIFEEIKQTLIALNKTKANGATGDLDPLLSRFQSLKTGGGAPTSIESQTLDLDIESVVRTEYVTPTQLSRLVKQYKVLLIDYRSPKEYNHNHINHEDVVNIEPAIITSLFNSSKELTDQDLEAKLRLHLTPDKFIRFQNRFKYDLVVIYNLRFGFQGDEDRLHNLKHILINDDKTSLPSHSPFASLVDLITYKNKYISSKLKRPPVYLAGGVLQWHKTFGDSSIQRTLSQPPLTRPEASLGRNSPIADSSRVSNDSGRPMSPYLKNFGEYLATAKSTSNTPVSNYFAPTRYQSTQHQLPALPSQEPPQQQKVPISPLIRTLSSSSKSSSNGSSKESATSTVLPVKFLEQYTTGLVNLGNSCYMNCVLQCLGATPQLTKFFFPNLSTTSLSSLSQSYRQHINVNNNLGSKGILTTNFVGLLANMFHHSGKAFSPNDFKKVVGSLSPGKQFATFDQQDCIEFLNFLLDGLHEDLNQMVVSNPQEKKAIMELTPEEEKIREVLPVRLASTVEWERYLKLNFSIVVDYFQGQYLSQLRCLECGLSSTTYNSFSILSLPIPEKLASSPQSVLLDDCLKEFTTTELLDDNNKWHCPRCKRFTKSTKKITLTRLPQVLIIHFKRFKISNTGYFNKLETFVKYPVNQVLDLTSYWPGVGTSVNDDKPMAREQEEQLLSKFPTRNQVPPFRYRLYGVANHFGNLTTGHYTSYVHKKSDNKKTREWCYFDDSKVTFNVSSNLVLNKNAYCLFFERI